MTIKRYESVGHVEDRLSVERDLVKKRDLERCSLLEMIEVQVPVDGATQDELEAVMQVLMDMGLDGVQTASPHEASQPGLLRKDAALVLSLPDGASESSARRMVDHALRDLKLAPRLYAGQPIAGG